MGFCDSFNIFRIGRGSNARSQSSPGADRLPKLPRQPYQRIVFGEFGNDRCLLARSRYHRVQLFFVNQPAGSIDRVEQRVFVGKVLKQRDDVGEGFVEGRCVRSCGIG